MSKRIIWLIILTLAILSFTGMVNTTVNKVITPEVTADLALEQFANPTATTSTMTRLYENNLLWYFNYGSGFVIGGMWLFAFRKELGGLLG